jgi:hypothetical protein
LAPTTWAFTSVELLLDAVTVIVSGGMSVLSASSK